jgi:uncharacterized protein with gpF-like domain
MSKRLTDSDPRREQRRQERMLLVLERKFRRVLASEIARASVAMVDQFKATGRAPDLPEWHERAIAGTYQEIASMSIEMFGERVVNQGKSLGKVIETKSFREFFLRLAMEYLGLEMIRRRITSVTETTRQQIVNQIKIGQQAGEGVDAIAKRITGNIPFISRQRGALIARTETHGAANYGADAAARATRLDVRKEWVAAADERTRLSHAEADGQVVQIDQPFTVDGEMLMFPGDPEGSGGNIINCRCAVSHLVD